MDIITGKDLIYDIFDYDIILIATNIKNQLSNGFQKKVAKSFPWVKEANFNTKYNDKTKLGTCIVSQKEGYPTFVLCYIFTGRYRPDIKPDVVDYKALESCLELIKTNFHGKKFACTILGHSPFEGGGDREKCLGIIKKSMDSENITIYDYEQKDWATEQDEQYHETERLRLENKISVEEYYDRKKKLLWQTNYGWYSSPPENVSYRQLIRQIKQKH